LFLLLLFWLPSLNLWFHELLLFLSEEDQYHPAGKDPQRFDDDLMIRSADCSALRSSARKGFCSGIGSNLSCRYRRHPR
jgi:hypothetical protein